MTVHHVIVAEPDSLDPDEFDKVRLHHVSTGDGCGDLWQECREPHLWIAALWSIADDEGTDDDTRDLASGMADDAECDEHVWHGQVHAMTYNGWCVPIDGCGFKRADFEYDLPPDLLPGVYAVTCEQQEWDEYLAFHLTNEPVPDPEALL